MKRQDVYDVWTDGSFRESRMAVGAAWLIRSNGQEIVGSRRLDKLSREYQGHGSDYAEVFAIACAVRSLPDGANAHWRVDAQNIHKWMEERRMTSKDKLAMPGFVTLFDTAVAGLDRLGKVTFTKIGGKNEELRRVNDLARAASSPQRM